MPIHPAVALLAISIQAAAPKQPPELGRVRFARDLGAALAEAKRDSKPAFVLFQEVPG
ncbi:MAG: hypothetical protein NTY35_05355 [Planctomycetota bacterium]|nr:hypothetical protein [Planctomycetota bacterium]